MKHTLTPLLVSLFTFHFSLLLIPCFAAVPLKWYVETSHVSPVTFDAYQGETIGFEAALQSYGKPLAAPSDYAFYWQTNGMGSAWWVRPCSITQSSNPSIEQSEQTEPSNNPTNVLFATWTPDMDVGAKAYTCFIGQTGTIYHAAFQLRLRPSPGATPNELPLPTPVIDFAKVTVLNPPWSGGGGVDTNAVREIVGPMIEGHHDGTKLDARSVHWEGDNLVFGEGNVYHNISMHTGVIKEVGSLQLERPTAISYLDTETGEQVVFDLSDVAKSSDAIKYTDEHVSLASAEWYIGMLSVGQFDVNGWDNLYSQKSETLPQYLASGEWNTATNPFAKMSDIPVAYVPSETDPVFSNAVLAVGIDTNTVAQIGELKEFFDGLPVGTVGTSLGGIILAILSAVAWLKKNAVTNGKKDDGSPEDPKLADFFTNSNSLLTGTIDDRLPIPISSKSAGFTTESYKRFVVTVSGDMTVTLHSPTGDDAEIFECRFNGSSLAADASITFAGATATTMDTDCGTVTAGKVALMSAFWNGTTWDVNWKVEG